MCKMLPIVMYQHVAHLKQGTTKTNRYASKSYESDNQSTDETSIQTSIF